ncbi:TIGR01841 family phasin PhaP3 [Cupriavidus taiwanensis]|uniref:Phasin polyhydroxyalkanoate synthesis and granule formation regulator/factor n=1 Tax=Cupriavidus taiwanensis TaxID=164546 RepID=A0A975ZYR8_9BURK|nr:TIGR01841 family phasin PhaP3 [Cupriavidus taiwanensis]MDK3022351.1 TIGR01841 family phasin PhaP3 [Cupriavidus taiwanensis]NSX17616.1 TIGR01841 family phasin PhaP3 [Cupriavidus taiwanensis]SOY46258.1 phasin; polyhydroxyalkanoate synthesis and granule formation regulator/factor [Cupriavidus taiwanensis]
MSPFTPEQFAAAQKSNMNHLFALTNTAFEGFQKLTELNLQTLRATLSEGQQNVEAVLAGKDVREVFAAQGNLAQPAAEKAAAYARHVYEIASNTQAELSKAVEAQYTEHNRNVQAFVDTFVKNAPAGSEALTALLQSGVAAASNTYQSFQDAAKQTAEVAKANFAKTAAAAASGTAANATSRAAKA